MSNDEKQAELQRLLDEYHGLMAEPVALGGMLLERLEAMRAAGTLPAPTE